MQQTAEAFKHGSIANNSRWYSWHVTAAFVLHHRTNHDESYNSIRLGWSNDTAGLLLCCCSIEAREEKRTISTSASRESVVSSWRKFDCIDG
mmetsp:Transcript_26173/g.44517  ORF Transcript_26173/g.44517 Transcript_26173/m.44517 type:complete len:92 (-) Transcript_26173:745-1020(-)